MQVRSSKPFVAMKPATLNQPAVQYTPLAPRFAANRASFWKTLPVLAASFLSPLGAWAGELYSDVKPDGTKVTKVNSARDISHVTGSALGSEQKVVDMLNNPLLSPKARREIEALLTDLQRKGQAEMAVVIIPSTGLDRLGGLGTEIYNQIGIGKRGSNKGALLLINAEKTRLHVRGQAALTPGDGSKRDLNSDRLPISSCAIIWSMPIKAILMRV